MGTDESERTNGQFRCVTTILNPVSGRGAGGRLHAALGEWLAATFPVSQGASASIVKTTASETARDLARRAVLAGSDLVVAAGGDGTLSGVVNGTQGSGAAVGLVPMGTGNDFARAIGVSLTPAEAVRSLSRGVVRNLDVGVRGDRLFINVAGCGLDAVVARRVNAGYRRVGGVAAYLAAVAQSLMSFRPCVFRVTVDGEVFEGEAMLCAVANGTSYGGGMRIAPNARPDDGMLDVCVILACTRFEFLRAFPLVFRGEHLGHPKALMFRGREVAVDCAPEQPVLMDGELAAPTPARFAVAPGAVRFVAPREVSR